MEAIWMRGSEQMSEHSEMEINNSLSVGYVQSGTQ